MVLYRIGSLEMLMELVHLQNNVLYRIGSLES